jgi:serine/threonine-protein kinase ULK4
MNWKISDDSLLTLNWCLEKSDDEIIKFYVVKTIENISALTQISKLYFTKDERFLVNLISVVNTTKNADLKVSAVYSISHIIRLEPKLFKIFVEKVGVVNIINLAEKENSKIQQALINILLNGIYKDNQIILKNEFLVPLCNFMLKLFETPNNVIRIKIMLIFTLIFENSVIVSKFGEKIFNHIQKFRKENSPEMLQAIKVFEATVQIKIKVMVKNFIYLLSNNIANSNYHDEILQHFNSFLTYNSYSKLLPFVYTQDLLEILIKIIDSDYISEETITKNIFQLISNFSENPKCVLDNNDFILKKMLIPLLSVCLK